MKLRDLVYMNKSDRQVMLTLLLLAAIFLCGIYFTGKSSDDGVMNGEEESTGTNGQEGRRADNHGRNPNNGGGTSASSVDGDHQYYYVEGRKPERFPFDPNTADSTALLRLGLRPWQVRNIYKFRAAGGIYRSKEDFASLYGLTVKEYRELEPYIRISDDYMPAATLFRDKRLAKKSAADSPPADSGKTVLYPMKIKAGETVDLNVDDTVALKRVPGIGSYYARRIVEYGRRLGGYVSVEQLDEIDGLPDDVKAFFTVIQPSPRQLSVNRLTLNELKRHPYVNYYQARAITDYRRLHGPIKSLSELRLLPEFPPEAIARLEPYVTYD